jgi:drug/metabolite transporter (DMT)-like permease
MYVVLVPVFSLFFGKKVRPLVFACVGLSVVGLYLLCMKDGYSLGFGDMITLVSALLFTFQILCVGHFSHGVYGPTLAAGMFLVEAVFATVGMLWTEKLSLVSLRAATGSILYAAVFSGCVAYTLQVVVQKHLSATLASIAMCCESVFSALAGWIVLGQTLSGRELSGCVIIFVSILTASLVSTEKA